MQIVMGNIEVRSEQGSPYSRFSIICKYTLKTPDGFKKESSVSARHDHLFEWTYPSKEEYAEALEIIAKQLRELVI